VIRPGLAATEAEPTLSAVAGWIAHHGGGRLELELEGGIDDGVAQREQRGACRRGHRHGGDAGARPGGSGPRPQRLDDERTLVTGQNAALDEIAHFERRLGDARRTSGIGVLREDELARQRHRIDLRILLLPLALRPSDDLALHIALDLGEGDDAVEVAIGMAGKGLA